MRPYVPPTHPYVPPMCPYMPPMRPLCTPYMPPMRPYVPPTCYLRPPTCPLHTPYTPLCAPYVPPTCRYAPPMRPLRAPTRPLHAPYAPPTHPYVPPTRPYAPLRVPYAPPTCPYMPPTRPQLVSHWLRFSNVPTTANEITGIDQAHYNKILIFFPTTSLKCLRAARIDELADSNEPANIVSPRRTKGILLHFVGITITQQCNNCCSRWIFKYVWYKE